MSLPINNATETNLGPEAKVLLNKLRKQAHKGIIFGQQDAALMGCEDSAGERWTIGKYWNWVMQDWLLDPALGIRSDLAYATFPQTLHPGVYGFDLVFIADIDFAIRTTPVNPPETELVAVQRSSAWPFEDYFGNTTPADTITPPFPIPDPTTSDAISARIMILFREIFRRIHAQGGIVTLTWHAQNPLITSAFDFKKEGDPELSNLTRILGVAGSADAVSHALPASLPAHISQSPSQRLRVSLSRIARFANFCTVADGSNEKIPMIFRPYHEMNKTYFWWGKGQAGNTNNASEYKQLYNETQHYLIDQGVNNFLYAYSPDSIAPSNAKYPKPPAPANQQSNKPTPGQLAWNNTLHAHTSNELIRYKPDHINIVGLDIYPMRFIDDYHDFRTGLQAFIVNVGALKIFAQQQQIHVTAIMETGVLDIFSSSSQPVVGRTPVSTGNIDTVSFPTIDKFWTENFAYLLENSFTPPPLPLQDGVDPELPEHEDTYSPAYFMLWKNRDANPAGQKWEQPDVEGVRVALAPGTRAQITPADGAPPGVTRPHQLHGVVESEAEFYGIYRSHPLLADFLQFVRLGSLFNKKGSSIRPRLLFLKDLPPQ